MTCSHVGCDGKATRRGLCRNHYQWHWQRGAFTPPPGARPARPGKACRGRDDIDWVPDTEHPDEPNTRRAVAVCADCPVRAACAEWAVGTPTQEGILGGLTTVQRKMLRAQQRQAARA